MASLESNHLTFGVPQGSVLGPVLFSLYVVQLSKIVDKYKIRRQLLADDSGLYYIFQPNQAAADVAVPKFESCCRNLKALLSANMLKLNDDKTEAILCGSRTQRSKVSVNSICVGESEISLCSVVKSSGPASLSPPLHCIIMSVQL